MGYSVTFAGTLLGYKTFEITAAPDPIIIDITASP